MSSGTKRERIIKVLQDNPGRWLSASDIAALSMWKCISSRDVSNTLRDEYTRVERKDVSTNSTLSLRYRYLEGRV